MRWKSIQIATPWKVPGLITEIHTLNKIYNWEILDVRKYITVLLTKRSHPSFVKSALSLCIVKFSLFTHLSTTMFSCIFCMFVCLSVFSIKMVKIRQCVDFNPPWTAYLNSCLILNTAHRSNITHEWMTAILKGRETQFGAHRCGQYRPCVPLEWLASNFSLQYQRLNQTLRSQD